jgi:hypothetical protein
MEPQVSVLLYSQEVALNPTQSQLNPVHILTFCFLKFHCCVNSHQRQGLPSDLLL